MKNKNEIMIDLTINEQTSINGGGIVKSIFHGIGKFFHRGYANYMNYVESRMADGTTWRMTD